MDIGFKSLKTIVSYFLGRRIITPQIGMLFLQVGQFTLEAIVLRIRDLRLGPLVLPLGDRSRCVGQSRDGEELLATHLRFHS